MCCQFQWVFCDYLDTWTDEIGKNRISGPLSMQIPWNYLSFPWKSRIYLTIMDLSRQFALLRERKNSTVSMRHISLYFGTWFVCSFALWKSSRSGKCVVIWCTSHKSIGQSGGNRNKPYDHSTHTHTRENVKTVVFCLCPNRRVRREKANCAMELK